MQQAAGGAAANRYVSQWSADELATGGKLILQRAVRRRRRRSATRASS